MKIKLRAFMFIQLALVAVADLLSSGIMYIAYLSDYQFHHEHPRGPIPWRI